MCVGSLFKKKEQKKSPQDVWMDAVANAVADSSSAPSNIRSFLPRLAELGNVPRNKNKFMNFLSNSLKIRSDALCTSMWDYLEATAKKEVQTNSAQLLQAKEELALQSAVKSAELGVELEVEVSVKKQKKSKRSDTEVEVEEVANELLGDGELKTKKKKKRVEREEEEGAVDDEAQREDSERRARKKLKKLAKAKDGAAAVEELPEESDSALVKKKKHKKAAAGGEE